MIHGTLTETLDGQDSLLGSHLCTPPPACVAAHTHDILTETLDGQDSLLDSHLCTP